MKPTFLRGTCDDGRECPNINLTDHQTFVVQGDYVTPWVVEIPLSLVPELDDLRPPCPDLTLTERGTVLVHGIPVTDQEALRVLNLPLGESAVEVPLSALPMEVSRLAQQ